MNLENPTKVCQFLQNHPVYGDLYRDVERLPGPYCIAPVAVKAIVLGADPSNPNCRIFDKVFGLEDEQSPYFRGIAANLREVGLNLGDIYVQNLCRNYFVKVTDDNPHWMCVANYWIPLLKVELDSLFSKDIPVFMTAGKLYQVLVCDPKQRAIAPHLLYRKSIFFRGHENHLDRVLIPLFRHPAYRLRDHASYAKSVRTVLGAKARA